MESFFGERYSEISLKKISAIVQPKKLDQYLYIKNIIDLYYQIDPMRQFNPQEQFERIKKIPLTQEKFCSLLTEVVFKKTKKFISSILSLRKQYIAEQRQAKDNELIGHNDDTKDLQNSEQNISKSSANKQKIQISGLKILIQMKKKIKYAAEKLQQLLFKLIKFFKWKCQHKYNCKSVYTEGFIEKVILKILIAENKILKDEIKYFFFESNSNNQPNQLNLQALIPQINQIYPSQFLSFAPETINQVRNFDQKSVIEIKYFICKDCQQTILHSKQAQKRKKKKKKIKKQINQIHEVKSNQLTIKDSLIDQEDHSTCVSQEINDQTKQLQQKVFEKINNFLQDFRVDAENRLQLRLQYQKQDIEAEYNEKYQSSLMKKLNQILKRKYYASSKSPLKRSDQKIT